MATLLRIIERRGRDDFNLSPTATPVAARALRTARSVLSEFASQDYNPRFEEC